MKRVALLTVCALSAVSFAQNKSMGAIKVTMSDGKSFIIGLDPASPKTVDHVTNLVKKKFYDGIKFHRVEGWVVQWGDPVSRKSLTPGEVGNGGSGHSMPFEESKVSFLRGVVGIASTGSKVGGDSQLFVLTKDSPHLNGSYAVLGKVIFGMDVVDKLKVGSTVKSMTLMAAGKKPVGMKAGH